VLFTTEIIKMVATERKIKVAALLMMLDDEDDELFT
jgi:predicted DNA-binding ribbon-helix-helix protein